MNYCSPLRDKARRGEPASGFNPGCFLAEGLPPGPPAGAPPEIALTVGKKQPLWLSSETLAVDFAAARTLIAEKLKQLPTG